MDDAGVDFGVVAWREDGDWHLVLAPAPAADALSDLIEFARRYQGETGAVAFVSVAEEFFVCLRVQGARVRVLLSDATSALDWPIAEQAADLLGLDLDAVAAVDDIEPAGDLTLLSDHGLPAAELDQLCGDPELYPDEQIGAIAAKVGFGKEFVAILDNAPA